MMNGMGWGGMWFGWIFWFVILVVIIWGVVTIVNNSRRKDQQNYIPANKEALEILKRRYASGEITREEFNQMKQDLQS